MSGGRNWISVALGHGIRVGRSIADPRLPSWRRFELRHVMQEAAIERGETLTIDVSNYLIDKALAIGLLDGSGDLSALTTGSRDEIIAAMIAAEAGKGERRTHLGNSCHLRRDDGGGPRVRISEMRSSPTLPSPLAMITPAQCRAARALLDWPREWLVSEASVGSQAIAGFEKGARVPRGAALVTLRRALEKAGVEFIAGARSRCAGVRQTSYNSMLIYWPNLGQAPRLIM